LSPFSLKSAFAGGFPPSLGLAFDVSAKAGTGNPPAIVQTIMAVFRSAVRLSDTRMLCCNMSMTEGVRRGRGRVHHALCSCKNILTIAKNAIDCLFSNS